MPLRAQEFHSRNSPLVSGLRFGLRFGSSLGERAPAALCGEIRGAAAVAGRVGLAATEWGRQAGLEHPLAVDAEVESPAARVQGAVSI